MAMNLSTDLAQDDFSKVNAGREAVIALETALGHAHKSISNFRQTIHSLPRMTTMLNKAKRTTLEILDDLLQVLENSIRDATEAGKVLDGTLGKQLNS